MRPLRTLPAIHHPRYILDHEAAAHTQTFSSHRGFSQPILAALMKNPIQSITVRNRRGLTAVFPVTNEELHSSDHGSCRLSKAKDERKQHCN